VQRITGAGHPFVFVSGNHDSDTLERELVDAGAIVLGREGVLRRDGTRGAVVVRVAGLRVAGYDDPFARRSKDRYADRLDADQVPAAQEAFRAWLEPLLDDVDVVMVHSPEVASLAIRTLHEAPPPHPLLLLLGHTHRAGLQTSQRLAVVNGGSIGAGGPVNAGDHAPLALARIAYRRLPRFLPLAADLVSIDPGQGAASAHRNRLDDIALPGDR
jgi:predicted phosphodiesterase